MKKENEVTLTKCMEGFQKEEILKRAGVLFWKTTKKAGTKFMPVGEYVIMKKQNFYNKFL